MESFLPYITGDGSVGLYSEEFNDIYHSGYGALTEAYEKFVLPNIDINHKLNVLDICYGLGYNSKSFLNYYGKNREITFDCLDIDKQLILLSPFIKTNHTLIDYFIKPNNKHARISKYKKYKIDDWVNIILIENLHKEFKNDFYIESILTNKKFAPYLNSKITKIGKFYQKNRINTINEPKNSLNLHNIYYQYLSKRYISNKNNRIKFNFYVDDARNTVKKLDKEYDVIFLDAFTTNKCPQLWSLDFINELYRLTAPNGVLLTYSNSVVVRNTFFEAGYFVGKILNKDNKSIGTIASKDNKKIKYKLNEYEQGLLKTRAGIPYRDYNLLSTAEEIINNRNNEVSHSNLISTSKYLKDRGKK